MLLEIKNLKTEFALKGGAVTALHHVNFKIEKGQILALVGESGSGKSVTSLSIMGLLSPPGKVTEGQILFHGEDLLKKSDRQMREIRGNRISMIFQEPMTSLNPVYRVGDQIIEAIVTHESISKAQAKIRAQEMLQMVGIPSPEERIHDFPHQMSGGMRQRVMIAMALSCSPDLLIADEPTTALDVTIQAQILNLLYDMRKRFHMAVLFITHDLGVVAQAADRVAVMYAGRIVEQADVDELFYHPLHPYTVGLLNSIPKMEEEKKRLYMIPGMVPNLMNMPKGCPFFDRCERRMEGCREHLPALTSKGTHEVRCFLYSEKQEAAKYG